MRIGTIVDGDGEYDNFRRLFARINSSNTYLQPIKGKLQPKAPVGKIAREIVDSLRNILSDELDLVIVTLDREDREDCPGELAAAITGTVAELCQRFFPNLAIPRIEIVIKDRMLENWIISDVSALKRKPGLFNLPQNAETEVSAKGADAINAPLVIRRWRIKNKVVSKRKLAREVLQISNPAIMERTSRSFRHLVNILKKEAER